MTILVVMGVAGCGKTTVGHLIATQKAWHFQEGDALHPPSNVAKMAGGTPLTDEDRWPWLHTIAAVIDTWRTAGHSGVVTCSALKRTYRDILIGPRPDVRLIYLRGDKPTLATRMAARTGHFMPPTLLDSQLATLQEPTPDENPLIIDIGPPPDTLVATILKAIG